MALRHWSTTASGNASVAGINWQEGQAPSTINNSAREQMSQVRDQYTPGQWHWVEVSNTASVASQTSFRLSTNLTADFHPSRRVRLTGGSSTRYASVVSSSYTAETMVTIAVDSGSLSASHTTAALGPAVANTPIGGFMLADQTATFTAPVIVAGPISITSATLSAAGATKLGGTLGVSATASFGGVVRVAGTLNAGGNLTAEAWLFVANDSNFSMQVSGGNPLLIMDSNDFLAYIRASNEYAFFIGGAAVATVSAAGVRAPNTAKAWLRANFASGTPTIVDSFNVSSLTDVGTGSAIVNFASALPNANYAMVGAGEYDPNLDAGNPAVLVLNAGIPPTTTSCAISMLVGSQGSDRTHVSCAFFGD